MKISFESDTGPRRPICPLAQLGSRTPRRFSPYAAFRGLGYLVRPQFPRRTERKFWFTEPKFGSLNQNFGLLNQNFGSAKSKVRAQSEWCSVRRRKVTSMSKLPRGTRWNKISNRFGTRVQTRRANARPGPRGPGPGTLVKWRAMVGDRGTPPY